MILGRYCNVKLDASNCRKQAKKKNSGFDRIQLYASQTLVGPCYRLSEKATFGGRALFRGDFYGHKKKSSWSTSVAPTACLHFDINIWEIWHVLCWKRTKSQCLYWHILPTKIVELWSLQTWNSQKPVLLPNWMFTRLDH